MFRDDPHISEQELLLAADGESSGRRAAHVRAHLGRCWQCRAKMAEIESSIVAFTRARHETLDPKLPPYEGSRALLGARLAELAASPHPPERRWIPRLTMAACVAALASIVVISAVAVSRHRAEFAGQYAVPDRVLTPGATRPVNLGEVCAMAHEEVVKEVPDELRQRVFAEYGLSGAKASDYEVDYLIAPGPGGTDSIQNLWPEPYRASAWNAHVKDALEERLHGMVCAHQLELSTAQRDIATDWIAAYKKYFHTEQPGNLPTALDEPEGIASRLASFHPMSDQTTGPAPHLVR